MLELPFDLVNDHVFVRARMNGTDLDLILDTGSSVSTLEESLADRVGAVPLPAPVTAAGAGRLRVRLATISSLALPGLDLGPSMVALTSLAGVSCAGGRRVDGTLGFDVFQRRAVEVDYSRQHLFLHEPGAFAPAGRVALPVDTARRIPLVDATLEVREGIRVPARLVVDLGSSALALRLAASFVEKHAAAFAGVSGVEAPIGAGVGGRLMGEVVRLRALHLHGSTVPSPTAGLAREKKSALEVGLFDGSIGAPVLKPWCAADYASGRIFLHAEMAKDDRYDASGLTLTGADDAVAVDFVAPRTPAAEAGLRAEDEILELDGHPIRPRDLDRVRAALRQAGQTLVLRIRRLGAVPVALRRLV